MCRTELFHVNQTADRNRRNARLPRLIAIVAALAIFGQSQAFAQAPTVTAVFNNSIPTSKSLSGLAANNCGTTVTWPGNSNVANYTTYPWNSGSMNGGYTATIVGTNLSSATAVHFGATAATNIANNTATQLTCTVPAITYNYNTPSTVVVTVTTSAGTSSATAATTAGAAPTALSGAGGGSTNQFIYAPAQVYYKASGTTMDQWAPCFNVSGSSTPMTMFGQYLYGALQTDFYQGNNRWGVCIPAYSDAATTACIMPNVGYGIGSNNGNNQLDLYMTCGGNVYTTQPGGSNNCASNAGAGNSNWGYGGNYSATANNYYGEPSAITQSGTITSTTSSATVTGTGTTFTTTLSPGSGLWVSGSAVGALCTTGTYIGTVYSIQSDTSLTLANSASNAAWITGNAYTAVTNSKWATGKQPTITGITVSPSGPITPNATVTITGTWGIGPVAVNFGTDFMSWFTSPTGAPPNPVFAYVTADNASIVVTAPSSAYGYSGVRVTNIGGTSPNGIAFVNPPPTVTSSTVSLLQNAATLTINGTNFGTTAANVSIAFSNAGSTGIAGSVTTASGTSLIYTFTSDPTTLGELDAVVTVSVSGNSGSAVSVATVVSATVPVVTVNTTTNLAVAGTVSNIPTLTINGANFGTNTGNISVTFSGAGSTGINGSVIAASGSSLTYQITTMPTTPGALSATVAVVGNGNSGAAVQVATILAAPVVTTTTVNIAQNAPTITIQGSGFSTTAANNVVTLYWAGGSTVGVPVGGVTAVNGGGTQLTFTISTPATTTGVLNAQVTVFGGTSSP